MNAAADYRWRKNEKEACNVRGIERLNLSLAARLTRKGRTGRGRFLLISRAGETRKRYRVYVSLGGCDGYFYL